MGSLFGEFISLGDYCYYGIIVSECYKLRGTRQSLFEAVFSLL